jgi:tetratricopeptide (TPR) repeat protein
MIAIRAQVQPMDSKDEDVPALQARAAAAYEAGRLEEARALYARLVELRPQGEAFHYRLGLAHKYLGDWPASLRHNLESLRIGGEHDESASWNAGIAATALGDWAQARRQWLACGIDIDPGEGAIEENFGPIGVRLNPWAGSEIVFAQRIDPARAYIVNVPLPESGHRFHDLVLQDGAQVGERHLHEHTVPVFNELQRLQASDYITYTVFVTCPGNDDIDELQAAEAADVGQVEDWTASLGQRCLRCAHGVPHKHHWQAIGAGEWNPDRTLGVAARAEPAVRALLEAWVAAAPGRRRLDAIECRESAVPPRGAARAWWKR